MKPAGKAVPWSTELKTISGFFLLLGTLPLFTHNEYILFIATQLWVYFSVAIGLNILAGYGGQTSIGHGALVAVGAYVTAIGMVDHHLSFWIVLPAAIAATAVLGAVMAIPAFRVSAWYFALITLAFAQVVQGLLIELQPFTHGFAGVVGIPMPSLGGYLFGARELYWTVLLFCIAAFFVSRNLVQSRYGRALQAMRDNPLAAVGSGISLVRLKLFAFIYSACLAGAAGAFFAVQKTVITPDDFSGEFSIFFLLVVVLGGMGRLYGALLGTLAFFLLPELMSELKTWRLLVYGFGLLLLIRFAPDGIAGAVDLLRARRGHRRSTLALDPDIAVHIPRVEGARLQVHDAGKRFGGVAALQGVSIDVPAGSIYALVGPNGSGKTTLLNLITGYYPGDSGQISVAGAAIEGRSADKLARDGIRRTFQTPKLVPGLSVLENVMLGSFSSEQAGLAAVAFDFPSARRERAERRAEALRYLRFVGLDARAEMPAGEVPHGQQRLAEIARALVARPRLLLLDEPAAGLSMNELDGLVELIRSISAIGTTVVIVEHHLDLVASLAAQVTVLEQGRVLASGAPAAVFKDPRVIAAYMGASGQAIQTVKPTDPAAPALLQVESLSSGYGRVAVIEGLSLSVMPGRICAVVGSNGAGKSTLLKTLSGLLAPSAGRIVYAGQDIAGMAPQHIVGLGLVHVAENRRLFRQQTVRDNLEMGLYGTGLGSAEEARRYDQVWTLFPALAERPDILAGALSGGQQQMLAIAQALMRSPRLLMLDEPSLGLAPVIVDQVLEILVKLRSEGCALLLVEQLVERALEIADSCYVMHTGTVIGGGTPAEVKNSDLLQRAYGADDALYAHA